MFLTVARSQCQGGDARVCPVSRGFHGRRRDDAPAERVPPGQYVISDFPVLSAGPTPHVPADQWTFSIRQAGSVLKSWTWQEMRALPAETVTADIHCVTRWSKLDTRWQAVSVDTLLEQAWLAFGYDGGPLDPEHGGPARLLVPHLYFWKSAKWVRGLELLDEDEPGFWETYGYHMYGDPWREQRYAGD